jgi:SAM-dependent methyltransferase
MITIINNVVNDNNFDDATTLKLIIGVLSAYPRQSSVQTITRAKDRTSTVMNMIKKLQVGKYLDYGCGDGTITQSIGKQLSLSPSKIFGVDIHVGLNPNITYIRGGQLNVPDESIDLVTAFVSLHHVADIESTLLEISKMLKPGGVFVIREHNFSGKRVMREYLHLVHMFVSVRDHGECNPDCILKDICYKTASEWTELITGFGFVLTRTESYTGNNPQALYYASYTRL